MVIQYFKDSLLHIPSHRQPAVPAGHNRIRPTKPEYTFPVRRCKQPGLTQSLSQSDHIARP
ncbi:hypothetical protein BR93DRAFT_926523 [Coniochaeta sp. PMI_546]|nr:hypothetical protein BR93DRAFT_926523 [Coniochaeta sp. PMI_546]